VKKRDLRKIALLGIAGGLLIQPALFAADAPASSKESVTQKTLTARQLYDQLSPEGKKLYDSLNDEGKTMALKLANQTCKGKNDCKGQNSCKTAENSCMGQGGCKGTSKGPFVDKNDAVKVSSMMMEAKRKNLQK
jgi:hypothetical protein